jgi:hypothetical protein
MKRMAAGIAAVLLAATMAYGRPDILPAGTNIQVRTNQTIEMKKSNSGQVYSGVVARDVRDSNGMVAIPRGSHAELVARYLGHSKMAVDLQSISVNGRRYTVASQGYTQPTRPRKGLGKNKRTAEFVGGGALLGTVVGAIAGGGTGAAVGAFAGAGAGAGTQTLTRGKPVKVPAESVLTFRLNQPLRLAYAPRRRG